MKILKENKTNWLKGLVVAFVFVVSLLNLSIDFNKDVKGDMDMGTLSITTTKAIGDWQYIAGAFVCPGYGRHCYAQFGGNTQEN